MTRGGWEDRRAYPLLIGTETEKALTRYRADKGLSLGRALNDLIRLGLMAAGYMSDPAKCQHAWEYRDVWTRNSKMQIIVCGQCDAKPREEEWHSIRLMLDEKLSVSRRGYRLEEMGYKPAGSRP